MPPLLNQLSSRFPSFKFTLIILGSLALSACDSGKAPQQSVEVAVKGLYSGAISANGEFNIVGSIHHGGSLWRSSKNDRLYNWNHKKGEYSNIIASEFSPDGNFALTADHQTMVLWDTQTGKALTFWTAPNEVLDIALTSNGNYAFLGLGDNSAVLFNVKQGGIQRSFYHKNRVNSVALSTDGSLAITGSDDSTAKLWDVNEGNELFEWQHSDEVVTVALSPDGSKALTVAKYDKAVIWDTKTGKAIGKLPLGANSIKRGRTFTSAAFSNNGNQLITGDADRNVQLWDSNNLKSVAKWTVPKRDPWKPTSASIVAVGFSNKPGLYLALASNGYSHLLSK